MAFRVRKSIRIAKGLSINVSKSGLSTSAKVGRVTVNSRRGATVNVAKGVSYNVPPGAGSRRGRASTVTPRAVLAASAGPRYVRRPWKLPGAAFWSLGIVAALLLGAIPAVGPFLLLGAVAALVVVWNITPKQIVSESSPPVTASAEAVAPTVPTEPTEGA